MSSSTITVPNPVSTPNAAQLAQIAADIAIPLQQNIQNGQYEDLYQVVKDLCAAVNCLAQSLITINNTTASSVGTVILSNPYTINQAVPTTIATNTR